MAVAAFVEPLAQIQRHGFHFPLPAMRTGEQGFENRRKVGALRIHPGPRFHSTSGARSATITPIMS